MKMTALMLSGTQMILVTIGLLAWPLADGYSGSAALIKVDGSSTVFPITEAVAEEFQKETRGAVRVTVGISGQADRIWFHFFTCPCAEGSHIFFNSATVTESTHVA